MHARKDKIYPDAAKILSNPDSYLNNSSPLCGVLNIVTNEIHLYPYMEKRIWIEIDESGAVVNAWNQEKDFPGALTKGAQLSRQEIQELNYFTKAPRALSVSSKKNHITSHQFVLHLINEEHNSRHFRGFSLIPTNGEYLFIWSSKSLNSKCVFDSGIMDKEHQKIVRNKLLPKIIKENNEEKSGLEIQKIEMKLAALNQKFMGLFQNDKLTLRQKMFACFFGKNDLTSMILKEVREEFLYELSKYIKLMDKSAVKLTIGLVA